MTVNRRLKVVVAKREMSHEGACDRSRDVGDVEVRQKRTHVHGGVAASLGHRRSAPLHARHRGRNVPLRHPHDRVLSRRARVPAERTPRGAEGRVPPPRSRRTRCGLQPRRDEASVPQAEGGGRKRHPLFAQSGRLQAIVRKNTNASEAISITASSSGFMCVTTTLHR